MSETQVKKAKPAAPAIALEPRMQLIEDGIWWEILKIEGDAVTCLSTQKQQVKEFRRAEVEKLAAESQGK